MGDLAIRTYKLNFCEAFLLDIPEGALLSVKMDGTEMYLVALIDIDAPLKRRQFEFRPDSGLPEKEERMTFIGSFDVVLGFVHLFVVKE